MAHAAVTVRLSDVSKEFLCASLDLLEAVEAASRCLADPSQLELAFLRAEELRAVIERGKAAL